MTFSFITGVINLVYALMGALGVSFAASYVTTLEENQIFGTILEAIGGYAFLWLSIILTAVWIIPDALLLVGINKKKPGFMLPWLIMKMILLVVSAWLMGTLDPLINVMDGISVMVGKFCKILVQKYTPHQLISNLSVFLEFFSYK